MRHCVVFGSSVAGVDALVLMRMSSFHLLVGGLTTGGSGSFSSGVVLPI